MCVREERAKELFYKRKNKNPKKPKPQTRDSPQKQKAPHKKKAYAITFPASHAPKLPPIPSHIPLNQPTLSTRKKRRKLFSIEPNPTKNAENDTKTKPKKKAHAHCILLSDSPLTPSLSHSCCSRLFLRLLLIFLAAFFQCVKGEHRQKLHKNA